MKKLVGTDIVGGYTFDPIAKTVTLTGLQYTIGLQNILLINNATANTIIYTFAGGATKGQTSFTNNVLSLDYDTTSMNASDALSIYVDVESLDETYQVLLRRMNKLLESNAIVDRLQRQRIVIDGVRTDGTGLTTECTAAVPVSGTVTAVASGTYSVSNGIASQIVANAAANPSTIASITTGAVMEGPVHQLWRVVDDARSCYASAIRSRLSFT
jgi:hypothetical protein